MCIYICIIYKYISYTHMIHTNLFHVYLYIHISHHTSTHFIRTVACMHVKNVSV